MLKYVKLLIALALVASLWPAAVNAQGPCATLLKDPQGNLAPWPDTVTIDRVIGKIGDTVEIPLIVKTHEVLSSFNIYLEFDTTWLKPTGLVLDVDPTSGLEALRFDYRLNPVLEVPRMSPDFSVEQSYYSTANPTHIRLKCNLFPEQADPPYSVPVGSNTLVWIPVEIAGNAAQGDQTTVTFYYVDIVDSSIVPPVPLACQYSQYADDVGTSIYPFTVLPGWVRVDTLPSPTINSFTASPSNISAGGTSTLSWNVSNADYVEISGFSTQYDSVGSVQVSPSATTSYTLTAHNSSPLTATATATVTVGTITGNAPVVQSIVPNSYTISQGGTVSFSVSATDADNDFITLSAINLPQNATFGVGGAVTGTGSATGQFSFTPNTTQEGTFQVSFQAVDNTGASSQAVTVTITVEGIQFDILYSRSRTGGTPAGGVPGKRSVLFPIDMVTAQTVYGVQFDMAYDDQWFTVDSIITTPRTQDWVVYDNIGQTNGHVRILTFGMNNEELQTDTTNSTTILYVAMTIDSGAAWGTYPIYLDSGWESNNPDPTYPSLALVTDSAAIQVDRFGDVNLDLRVDVADAVNVVATILGNVTLLERQSDVADLIVDNVVDVFDLVGVVNMIYGVPVQPAPGSGGNSGVLATVALDYKDMFSGSSDMLKVRSDLPEDIAGVQLNLTYDPSSVVLGKPVPTAQSDGLTMTYKNDGFGHMTVLLHFTNPFNQTQLIHSGAADLLDIPIVAQGDVEFGDESQLKLSEVKLSNAAAGQVAVDGFGPTLPASFTLYQNYPNPFNPTTTIEFALRNGNQHVTLDIFNVLGQQVRNLVDRDMAAGQYNIEWDATNSGGSKVATGIYFYRLTAGSQTDTKKMLLLK